LTSLLFILSGTVFAQRHEVPRIPIYGSSYAGVHYNPQEVCKIEESLPNNYVGRANGRVTYQTGLGCLFDETYLPTGEVTYNVFRAVIFQGGVCPAGYNLYADNTVSPERLYCGRDVGVIANKPCPICDGPTPDEVGNPIATSTGTKIERTVDLISTAVSLKRNFRSKDVVSNQSLSNIIGKGWYSDLTRRIIITPSDGVLGASAMVLRNDGATMFFSRQTNGQWLPEADMVRYRLEEVQLNGLTNYVLTSSDNHQEFYDATGNIYQDVQDGQMMISYLRDYSGLITAIQDRNGRVATVSYLASGLIDKITLPDGQLIDYDYDSNNRLITVTKSGDVTTYSYTTVSGGSATYLSGVTHNGVPYSMFTYDAQARANSTEHAGGVDHYGVVYSSDGNSATVTTPTGATKNLQFNVALGSRIPSAWQITGTGVLTSGINFAYDANSNPISKKGDQLLTCSYYDASGRYKVATYEFAVTVVATCPATQTAAAASTFLRGNTTQWDAIVNVPTERKTYNVGNVLEARTVYTYNSRGQATAVCQIDPNNTTAMAYVCGSATNAPVGVRQSITTYCEAADVTAGTCPIVGLAVASNGPRTDVSDISTFTYYQTDDVTCATAPTTCPHRKGDLWKVTNALNQTSEYLKYDGAGRALQMKDANNVITDMEYHARGWLTAKKIRGTDDLTEADDAITRMEYDLTGQVTKVIQADGDFVSFNYDAAHRLTSVTDALNNSITYTLDNAGNRTVETTKDPGNTVKRSLSRVYDTLGRLQISKNAASATLSTLTYDANDNLNTTTDGLNRVTDQDVDPLNRLIKTIQDQGVGKINATTQFEYDARDNLTKVIDPKNLNTVYTYNGLNDLTALSSPDTGSTSYTYDNAGNRLTQTDARNKTSTYSYDSANRLTQVALPTAAQNVFFDYDTTQADCQVGETFTTGRLARIRDESGSTRYCYNRLGQPVRKVQSIISGPNLTLGSTYNAANRTIAMTYPSGAIVTYLRNAKGQITGVSAKPTAAAAQVTMVSNVTYLPFGPLNTLTFGNGRVLTKAYDQNYDIDKVSDNSTTGLSEDSTVNVMGNITAITERTTATATATRQFAYDNLDRLLSLKNGATNVQSFTYDATGNRLSKTLATTTTTSTYPATSHRLSSDGTSARTYDANGNTATLAAKSFVYDDRNRLRDYINSGTTVTRTYRYNGKGERVSKVQSAGNTNNRYYMYDEAGHLLGEYLANGTRVQEYVWMDDQLVAVLSDHDASTYQFVETDHLGTPRAVIHPVENNIVWRWNITNTAFGEHTATNNPDADAVTYTFNLRYPGQQYDAESTLHYNYFRDYDSGVGRYVQSDPIGLGGGISTFGYVGGNPGSGVDPFGLLAPPSGTPVAPAPVIGAPVGAGLLARANAVGMVLWAGYEGLEIGANFYDHFEGPIADGVDYLAGCGDGNKCPPCNPSVGTIGYRAGNAKTAPHYNKKSIPSLGAVAGWVPGPHLNLFVQIQSPPSAGCKCNWQNLGIAVPPPARPEWYELSRTRTGR
jgi:RHS repeat-associated protein